MKKQIIKLAGHLFPNVLVNMAFRSLTNPQVMKLRKNEFAVLELATKSQYAFENFRIQTYSWGKGRKKVLLVHGWEGQAGNFNTLIERLLLEDFSVYAFDGPSHGFSSRGTTSIVAFTKLVGEMIKFFAVDRVVSHSFGAVATTYALSTNPDLELDKYVLLTTPNEFSDRIDYVAEQVGISKRIKQKLILKLEKELGIDVKALKVSDWVQQVKVKKALILHDKNDRVLPLHVSQAVNAQWDACSLEEVEGTGHFKILKEKKVLDRIVTFLA
jgi:pimeloyl-ACP methyl ester carboxylesterase